MKRWLYAIRLWAWLPFGNMHARNRLAGSWKHMIGARPTSANSAITNKRSQIRDAFAARNYSRILDNARPSSKA